MRTTVMVLFGALVMILHARVYNLFCASSCQWNGGNGTFPHNSHQPQAEDKPKEKNRKPKANCLLVQWMRNQKKRKAVRKWILNRIRTIIYMKTKSLLSILSFLYCFGMPFSVNDGKPFSAVEGSLLSCSRTMIDTVNMYSYVSVCVCVMLLLLSQGWNWTVYWDIILCYRSFIYTRKPL